MASPFKRGMFVVAVVAIIGAVTFAPHQRPIGNDPAVIELAQDNLITLSTALQLFRNDVGRFPLTAEGLGSLVYLTGVAGWKGPYIVKLKPDPWGREFEYRSDGARTLLLSSGADGIPGTMDDILPPELSAMPPANPFVKVLPPADGLPSP